MKNVAPVILSIIESSVGIGYVSLCIHELTSLASENKRILRLLFGVATKFDAYSCRPCMYSIISFSGSLFSSLLIDFRRW